MRKPDSPPVPRRTAPALSGPGLYQRAYRFRAAQPADVHLVRAMLGWAIEGWQATADADGMRVAFTLRIGLLSTGELRWLLAQLAAERVARTLETVHEGRAVPAAESALRPTRGVRRRAIAGLKLSMALPDADRVRTLGVMRRLGLEEFPELQGP